MQQLSRWVRYPFSTEENLRVSSTTRALGYAVVDMFSPGFMLPNDYPSGDTAEVEMRQNGARVNAPFYIVVSC